MVKGLDIFRERLAAFSGSYILIGGVACDNWFGSQGLTFRATKDLDIVLLVEVLNPQVVAAMRAFVKEGGYEIQWRTSGSPKLYRFEKPTDERFPVMLEFFSRNSDDFALTESQTIIPVELEPDYHSLSAILLDDNYYELLQTHRVEQDGLPFATVDALIPLKVSAWLDLSARRANGEKIDSKSIDKHRNDVFRLAATLPGEAGPEFAEKIVSALGRFLDAFPESSEQWNSILASVKSTVGGNPRSATLRAAIQTYFRLH